MPYVQSVKRPRLNCRGNFVEAWQDLPWAALPSAGLGLTAEATSLRRHTRPTNLAKWQVPRLNCRGNFVEATNEIVTAYPLEEASA